MPGWGTFGGGKGFLPSSTCQTDFFLVDLQCHLVSKVAGNTSKLQNRIQLVVLDCNPNSGGGCRRIKVILRYIMN